MENVAITGMGVISSLELDTDSFYRGLAAARFFSDRNGPTLPFHKKPSLLLWIAIVSLALAGGCVIDDDIGDAPDTTKVTDGGGTSCTGGTGNSGGTTGGPLCLRSQFLFEYCFGDRYVHRHRRCGGDGSSRRCRFRRMSG